MSQIAMSHLLATPASYLLSGLGQLKAMLATACRSEIGFNSTKYFTVYAWIFFGALTVAVAASYGFYYCQQAGYSGFTGGVTIGPNNIGVYIQCTK